MNEVQVNEKLLLEYQKKLSLSGVISVDGFSDKTLSLSLNNVKLKIIGDNIKITSYNKANGNLTADGDFYEFKYVKKTPLLKKIFK